MQNVATTVIGLVWPSCLVFVGLSERKALLSVKAMELKGKNNDKLKNEWD